MRDSRTMVNSPGHHEFSTPQVQRDVTGHMPSRAKMRRDFKAIFGEEPPASTQATTSTGGVKADAGKPDMSLIAPEAIVELAKVLSFGAKKYAAHNWRGGLKESRILAALLRHTLAYMGGEDLDPETGLPHPAHIMCNAMFLVTQHPKRPDLDDRYKEAPPDA